MKTPEPKVLGKPADSKTQAAPAKPGPGTSQPLAETIGKGQAAPVRTDIVEKYEAMRKAWGECSAHDIDSHFESDYAQMFGTVKDSGITAIDVEAFCVMLPEFQGEKNFSFKAGLFLSALINSSKESRFIVHTRHLAEPIDVLGYKNTKDIVVNGNAGHGIGIMMESGTIVVNGNVGECLGDRMSGGSITVNGDSGIYTGDRMEGGELRVNGSIDDLSPLFRGGNVFENGRPYLS